MSTKGSAALSQEIERSIEAAGIRIQKNLEPISAEQVKRLGDVLLWRVLLEDYVPRYRGNVVVAGRVDEAEQAIAKVGRILAEGCFAWSSKTGAGLDLTKVTPRPKVGDYVLFEMYAGQQIELRTGHRLRLINETEILMRVNDPDLIKGYL